MDLTRLQRKSENEWCIQPHGKMRVPAVIFASEALVRKMDEKVYEQVTNVASLRKSFCTASAARPNWTSVKRLTAGSRKSSILRRIRGESKSFWSKSNISTCPRRCTGPWPNKPKRDASGTRRSFMPMESFKPQKLAEAAEIISKQPNAMHLRFLQSLVQVSAEKNHTIVLPVPTDVLRRLLDKPIQ